MILTALETEGFRKIRDCGVIFVRKGPATVAMYRGLLDKGLVKGWHFGKSHVRLALADRAGKE